MGVKVLKGRKQVLVAATAAAVVAGGSAAWATIPSAGGTIDSCYDGTTGALRVVDSAAPACKATEKPLSFNQRGQIGPTGMRGPQGPPGPVNQHWAKFSGDNKLIAASEKPSAYYPYASYGYNYVQFTDVPDLNKCAVTVTAGTATSYKAVQTAYQVYANSWLLAYTMDDTGKWLTGIPMDVTVNCTQYAPYIP